MEMSMPGEGESTAVKPLVLPIVKFSYTTTSAERNSPLGWTHLSGGADLVVIFDQVKVPDQHLGQTKDTRYLRVQRGMEVLEELNLGSLAQEASAGSTHPSPQPQNVRSSVAVLVKSPCLAVRYPTSINQIRRFQVKFSCDADYYKAISILSEIGCPITESTTGTGHPPASSYPAKPGSSGLISNIGPSGPVQPYSAADVPTIRPSSIGSSSTLSAAPGPRNDRVPASSTSFPRFDPRAPNDRPSTAPSFQNPESLSQILPPKRELPFAKPSPKTAHSRPNPTTEPASTPTSGIQTNFTGIPSTQPVKPWSPHPLPYNRHLQASTAANEPFTTQRQLSQPPPPPPPQQQQQPTRPPLAPTTPTFINQLNTTPPTTVSSSSTHQPQDPTPAQILPPPTTADLSTYLSTPAPERHAQLEAWVCHQLESDGFLALCQDVEGVWRRVAYGH